MPDVYGTNGNEVYYGNGSNDVITEDVAGTGNDTMFGGTDYRSVLGISGSLTVITGAGLDLKNFDSSAATCFGCDTLIVTREGPVRVADLSVGAKVRTLDNGYQPVRWIGKRRSMADRLARNGQRPLQGHGHKPLRSCRRAGSGGRDFPGGGLRAPDVGLGQAGLGPPVPSMSARGPFSAPIAREPWRRVCPIRPGRRMAITIRASRQSASSFRLCSSPEIGR